MRGGFKMFIKCTLSVSLKSIRVYAGRLSELPPLPQYITRRGPFIHKGVGGEDRIIIIFEFDKSRLAEAWENISNQLDTFHDIPGFTFSAHRSIVFAEAKDKQPFKVRNKNIVRTAKKEM